MSEEEFVVEPSGLRAAQGVVTRVAGDLQHDLAITAEEVDSLLKTWCGGAADKWTDGWSEVHDSAKELFEILASLGTALGETASLYEERERENAAHVASSAPTARLSL